MRREHRLIAVVHDDTAFIDLMCELLADEGYEVACCKNGCEARALIREQQQDLVILDIRLDHAEAGWNVLELLRREPATVAPYLPRSTATIPKSAGLQIACMSIRAGVEVLLLLLGAGLYPGDAFRIDGPYPPAPPVHFSFSEAPPADLVEELRGIPDTHIVEAD